VLNAIADDYEALETIYSEVSSLGARCGLINQNEDIVQGLVSLIATGLAKAYRLRSSPIEEVEGLPERSEMNDLYFWVTPKGKDLQLSNDDWWPFDDEGSLRGNWAPPQ
jgi:hypothetical protein